MGEAKRRHKVEAEKFSSTSPMRRSRFTLLTIGTRMAMTAYMSDELSWWTSADERVLGLVALDQTDKDFLWVIFLRDRIGRFRCSDIKTSVGSKVRAESDLLIEMSELVGSDKIAEFGIQGDETNNPINLFELPADQDHDKLHPFYKILKDDPAREPARLVLSELSRWLAPADPHLVREFQTTGFDPRIWEFYLWAAFKKFFFGR